MSSSSRGPSSPLRFLRGALDELAAEGRLRERPALRDQPGSGRLNLCSNDYLGYASGGRLRAAAMTAASERWSGAGASRLIFGEHAAHRELEEAVAAWLGTGEALAFTSGYAANVGVLSALAAEGDLVVSDVLNHASIIDGCRLSRADVSIVPHLDTDAVRAALRGSRARRRWVVTETYFSMDGDVPDLAALRRICDEEEAALVVDEAHALGVFGRSGAGLCAEAGVRPDVLVGTLGKALGAQGAFVAGSPELCAWLWNRARSFVFSTGLSPLLAAVAAGSVASAQGDDAGRRVLFERSAALRSALAAAGTPALAGSRGPILPVVVGDSRETLRASRALAQLGVDVQAIRPPTVAPGTARLRVTATALLSVGDVERAGDAFRRALADVRCLP